MPKHLPALDGLRAVAILMVILVHVTLQVTNQVTQGSEGALSIHGNSWPATPTFSLPDWVCTIGLWGANGVQLFFVVSAFTLTIGMDRYGGNILAYAVRRLARVGPAYWIAGIIYTLLAGLNARMWLPDDIRPLDLLVAFLFGSAWIGGAPLAVVPGGWSVCCEVAFYVALPIALRAINYRLWRGLLLAVLAIALAIWRFIDAASSDPAVPDLFVSPTQQAPVFLFGIVAAIIYRDEILLPKHRWRGPASLAVLLAAVLGLPLLGLKSYLIFAILAAVSVSFAAHDPPWLLANAAMRRIGEVSYSMYLVHFVILFPSLKLALWLLPAADWRTMMIHYAVTVSVTFVIACGTYAAIERPAIRWAGRLSGR